MAAGMTIVATTWSLGVSKPGGARAMGTTTAAGEAPEAGRAEAQGDQTLGGREGPRWRGSVRRRAGRVWVIAVVPRCRALRRAAREHDEGQRDGGHPRAADCHPGGRRAARARTPTGRAPPRLGSGVAVCDDGRRRHPRSVSPLCSPRALSSQGAVPSRPPWVALTRRATICAVRTGRLRNPVCTVPHGPKPVDGGKLAAFGEFATGPAPRPPANLGTAPTRQCFARQWPG